jgi:hypothetical protein
MSTRKRSTEMYRGHSRVYGIDEYFESGGGGTTYILPPNIADNNVFFSLLSQKFRGKLPQFRCIGIVPASQSYSSQLEVT